MSAVVTDIYTDVQNQNAVSAYFLSKQILPFDFALHSIANLQYNQSSAFQSVAHSVLERKEGQFFCEICRRWKLVFNNVPLADKERHSNKWHMIQ